MMPSIFISRSEDRCRDFIAILKPYASDIKCISLISFESIPIQHVPKADWLFFYSQKGVDYFYDQIQTRPDLQLPEKIGCFGPKTAEYLLSKGIEVDFEGYGEAKQTAKKFAMLYPSQTVLFVKGANSLDSVKKNLPDTFRKLELVVYSNQQKFVQIQPAPDILCFTSPLNLQAYLKSNNLEEHQKIIVIGTSTAVMALSLDIDEIHIADTPSIVAMAQLAKSLVTDLSQIN